MNLCTCGRQKTYEECCRPLHYLPFSQYKPPIRAAKGSENQKEVIRDPKLQQSVIDLLTWPRHQVYMHGQVEDGVTPVTEDHRAYSFSVALRRPGYGLKSDRVLNLDVDKGASHFRVHDANNRFGSWNTLRLSIDGDSNKLEGSVDSEGYLTHLRYGPFEAASFREAEWLGSVRSQRAASLLAMRFESPLDFGDIRIEQLATRKVLVVVRVPDWEVRVPTHIQVNVPEMMHRCAAFYREGINAQSPLYAFLCFYKVITTIRKARKQSFPHRNFQKEFKENLPDDEVAALQWLRTLHFVESISWTDKYLLGFLPDGVRWGMSFGEVFEKVLRKKRHEIAHAFEENSVTIDPDDVSETYKVLLMLPLIKAIARTMAKNTYPHLLSPANQIKV